MSYISQCLKEKKLTGSDIILGIFFIITAAVIPLISHYTEVPVSDIEQGLIRANTSVGDVFSYDKSVFIKILGVLTALFMFFQIISGDGFKIDFKKPATIMALVIAVLTLVSAIFSPYKDIAFNGISERYEGFWVILCYLLFFIVAMNYAKSPARSIFLVAALMLSALFVGLVGLFQFFGLDIFGTQLGARLVLGDLFGEKNQLAIKFTSVYATLYNPNCAGMFFGMMFSFTAITAVVMPFKNKLKYVFAVLAVITLISLIGSDSAGGFIGAAFGCVFTAVVAVIYLVSRFKNTKIYAFCGISLVVLALALVVLLSTNNIIAQKIKIITSTLKSGENTESSSYFKDFYVENGSGIIVTDGGIVKLDFDGKDSELSINDNVLSPVTAKNDENGGTETTYDGIDNIIWTIDTYEDTAVVTSTDSLKNDISFIFTKNNGELVTGDKFGNPVTEDAKSIGFKGIERLGSNRGYIWSRSIPLMFKNILIGSGADCFALVFPQNDVRAKLQFLANPYVIVDKPHNMYIQMGINNGGISLVVMLVLFVMYIVQTIKHLFGNDKTVFTAIKLGILAGTVAYMVAGLTTDSVVSVAPVFWIMLGTGFGLNMIKTEKSVEAE